jgi:CDP-diacylglycerol--glycerol-3-phosphate 3-phosphatidyltransferase
VRLPTSILPHTVPEGVSHLVGVTVAKTRVSPNALTIIGLLGNGVAAALAAYGHFWEAGIVLLASGAFDMLDGAVARATNRATRGGAILDAVVDRVADFSILIGLLVWFSSPAHFDREIVILAGVAIAGAALVPYTRAKAAEFGVQLRQGLGTRAERVVILSIGLFTEELTVVLWLLAVLTFMTALQRLAVALWAVRQEDLGDVIPEAPEIEQSQPQPLPATKNPSKGAAKKTLADLREEAQSDEPERDAWGFEVRQIGKPSKASEERGSRGVSLPRIRRNPRD